MLACRLRKDGQAAPQKQGSEHDQVSEHRDHLAQETHNFADEIRQYRPENREQTDDRNAPPGYLRKRQNLAGAGLMTRAKVSGHRSAVAALPGGPEIEARALIACGHSLRRSGSLGKRIDSLEIGCFEGIVQVNAFASFHCWQHVGLTN